MFNFIIIIFIVTYIYLLKTKFCLTFYICDEFYFINNAYKNSNYIYYIQKYFNIIFTSLMIKM